MATDRPNAPWALDCSELGASFGPFGVFWFSGEFGSALPPGIGAPIWI
jgi:hypothetical protein